MARCPQDWSENPELGLWVKRQRIARAAGQLRCARAAPAAASQRAALPAPPRRACP